MNDCRKTNHKHLLTSHDNVGWLVACSRTKNTIAASVQEQGMAKDVAHPFF